MSERIFEEVAVVIKQNYSVRLLGYKENESEFTEINVFNKKVVEINDELSDYFAFGFTLKGRWEKEKEKIERMNERNFEKFIRRMTRVIERKYHIVHQREEKKEERREVRKEAKPAEKDPFDF